jgi:hypothetical protein
MKNVGATFFWVLVSLWLARVKPSSSTLFHHAIWQRTNGCGDDGGCRPGFPKRQLLGWESTWFPSSPFLHFFAELPLFIPVWTCESII